MKNIIDFQNLIELYKREQQPIMVDFRKIKEVALPLDSYTHLIHPYPAKLLSQIPRFFFLCDMLSSPGDYILDPFSGSGTVLLEGALAGRKVIGIDSNPLARLISKVKITYIQPELLKESLDKILSQKGIRLKIRNPQIKNLTFWFPDNNIRQLKKLKYIIAKIPEQDIRDFFMVCFSNCVKKVSFANPSFSVPVKLNADNYSSNPERKKQVEKYSKKIKNADVFEIFSTICIRNIRRMQSIKQLEKCECLFLDDARKKIDESIVKEQSIQLIITSPPYVGAQKYIRSSSLSLGWLGYCDEQALGEIKRCEIGREDLCQKDYQYLSKSGVDNADELLEKIFVKNSSRAGIALCYLHEMRIVIANMYRLLKPGGYMVLVVGNNKICGYNFMTATYLKEIAMQTGFRVFLELIDDIKSRGLMVTRNKTASVINSEVILLLQKDNR